MTLKLIFSRLSIFWLLIMLAVSLAFCIFTLGRGFDITDESYALLLAMNPKVYSIFVSAGFWVTSLIWKLTGTLFLYRLIGLGLIVCGAGVLAYGVIQSSARLGLKLIADKYGRASVIVSTIVLALHWECYGATVFFSPTYNLLATFGCYSVVGLVLAATAMSSGLKSFSLDFASGCFLAIVFMSKFPAGIAIFSLAFAIVWILGDKSSNRVFRCAIILLGLITTLVIILLLNTTPMQAVSDFKSGLAFYHVALQESALSRLQRNALELALHYGQTLKYFCIPLILAAAYAFSFRTIAGVLCLAFMIGTICFGQYYSAGIGNVQTQMSGLISCVVASLIIGLSKRILVFRQYFFLVVLFVLPYCVAIGTSNSFPPQIIVSLGSWGALISILAYGSFEKGGRPYVLIAMNCIFVGLSTVQLIASGFSPAYNLADSIFAQSEPVKIDKIGEVSVDHGVKKFIEDLSYAAKECDVAHGASFLGFYNIPGVALILGALPIATPWLIDNVQSENWLKNIPNSVLKNSLVAVQVSAQGTLPILPESLKDFPKGFELCGTAKFPYQSQIIQIWSAEGP